MFQFSSLAKPGQLFENFRNVCANFRIAGEDLIPVIKEREKAKKEEEARIRREAEEAAKKRSMMGGFGGQGGMMMMRGGGGAQGATMVQSSGNAQGTTMVQGGANQQGATMNQGAVTGQRSGMGQGRVRDTAAMRQRMQQFMKDGKLDTAAMIRSFQQQRGNMGGAQRDTSARRQTSGGNQEVIRQSPAEQN